MSRDKTIDAEFMAHAIMLAKKGLYSTSPNPRVGCLLVKDHMVISEGWHIRAGEAHAEINALEKAIQTEGTTAYVTLEPCSHYGRTGPCADALIKAGVVRVVVAMQDPNPLVSGKGIALLKQAGIVVDCNVLSIEAEGLNEGFIKRMRCGLPRVRSKLAMSTDGKTAMSSGESQWITGIEAREDVQKLRAESCVVLTGIGTILADNPGLNVRLETEQAITQPIRVIVDSELKMSDTAKILRLPGRTLILTLSEEGQKHEKLLIAGAEVYCLQKKVSGRLDLSEVLWFLAEQQINDVLIEAGAVLNGAFMSLGLIDECIIYMAPCLLGGNGRNLFDMPNITKMIDKKLLNLCGVRQVGVDLRLHYKVQN